MICVSILARALVSVLIWTTFWKVAGDAAQSHLHGAALCHWKVWVSNILFDRNYANHMISFSLCKLFARSVSLCIPLILNLIETRYTGRLNSRRQLRRSRSSHGPVLYLDTRRRHDMNFDDMVRHMYGISLPFCWLSWSPHQESLDQVYRAQRPPKWVNSAGYDVLLLI